MVSAWTPRLEVGFPAPFGREEQPDSPPLDPPATGLRIAARDLEVADGKARFRLLITWGLPLGVKVAYQRLDWAVGLFLEDAAAGRCVGKLLIDPHRRYPELDGANFKGAIDGAKKGTEYGWRDLELEVEAAPPAGAAGPSLFVRVALREWVSNTLALDLGAQTVTTS